MNYEIQRIPTKIEGLDCLLYGGLDITRLPFSIVIRGGMSKRCPVASRDATGRVAYRTFSICLLTALLQLERHGQGDTYADGLPRIASRLPTLWQ